MTHPPPDPKRQAAAAFLAAQAREIFVRAAGLACRRCGCVTSRVYYTVLKEQVRFRRRECIQCRHRFSTVEKPV